MHNHNFIDFNDCLCLKSGYLVTVNLQHLYECRRNQELQSALFASKRTKLCLDGRGAQIIFQRYFGQKLPRAVGNEILHAKLCSLGPERVLVVGTNHAVMEEIRLKYPAIEFTHDASMIADLNPDSARKVASSLATMHGTSFAFVALALGVPKQELLARELTKLIPESPIFCIGGSFEMLSGHIVRAPLIAQRLGIEGVWRFILQPNSDRLSRVVNSYWNFIRFFINPRMIGDLLVKSEIMENEYE